VAAPVVTVALAAAVAVDRRQADLLPNNNDSETCNLHFELANLPNKQ
jgi:hypothetical protein